MNGSGVPPRGLVICPPPYPAASPLRLLEEDSKGELQPLSQGLAQGKQEESVVQALWGWREVYLLPKLGTIKTSSRQEEGVSVHRVGL